MAEVTTMRLKVNLNCCKCYKKVKKVLCKFPEIRDQVYDEKQNTVTIKVVSCCPEKLRQKIRCKGGKSIECIEIIKPPPKPEEQQKPKPEGPPKKGCPPIEVSVKLTKPGKNPPQKPAETEKPRDAKQDKLPVNVVVELPQCKSPERMPCKPPHQDHPIPRGVCCRDCYEGRGGGPCQQLGYVCRYPCYCGCHERPVFDSWGGCSRSRCEIYSEEYSSACSVM